MGFMGKRSVDRERLDRVVRLYLGYKFFNGLLFAYPIFYEFAAQRITPVQVGIFFSIIAACSFVAEVPTGILADKHGRKSSGLFGLALLCVAPLVVFFGHSFSAYIVAAVFYGVGRSFLSGALEALVYDHKNVSKLAYRRVNMLEITFGQAGILASAACGGLLFSLGHGLPFIAEAIASVVCLMLVAGMQEINKVEYAVSSHRQHFVESMRHLFATPYLRVLVLMGVTFSVMLGMCIQFVNEAAMIEYGLEAELRGFLIAGAGIVTLVVLHLILLRFVTSDIGRILYLSGGAVAAYLLMSLGDISLFLLGYLLWCCLNATSSFIRVMLHDRIPGSHRSTILSNFKALAVLVGLGASTATGLLIQWAGSPRAAYVAFGCIAVGVLLPCAFWFVYRLKRTDSLAVSTDGMI